MTDTKVQLETIADMPVEENVSRGRRPCENVATLAAPAPLPDSGAGRAEIPAVNTVQPPVAPGGCGVFASRFRNRRAPPVAETYPSTFAVSSILRPSVTFALTNSEQIAIIPGKCKHFGNRVAGWSASSNEAAFQGACSWTCCAFTI